MHILIIGAAGMIGRKLTERLARDGALGGKAIDKTDAGRRRARRRAARKPFGQGRRARPTSLGAGRAAALVAERPDVIFHLAAIVSGEAEADFEKGYRINLDGTRALLEAIRAIGDGYRPRLVFTSSIAVFGAPFPEAIARRVPPHAADLLRHAEGDRRAAARRLYAPRLPRRRRHPAADHLRAAGQAQQGGVRLLLVDHPRAARRPGGGAAGRRQRAALARQPARRCRLPRPCRRRSTRDSSARASTSPCRASRCTVAEQIAALRRIAGDKVAARIRREPDPLIVRIVAGWPRRFDPKRALALGFRAETEFDEIIRVHIEDELGGKIAA